MSSGKCRSPLNGFPFSRNFSHLELGNGILNPMIPDLLTMHSKCDILSTVSVRSLFKSCTLAQIAVTGMSDEWKEGDNCVHPRCAWVGGKLEWDAYFKTHLRCKKCGRSYAWRELESHPRSLGAWKPLTGYHTLD
eukprot:g43288.t1